MTSRVLECVEDALELLPNADNGLSSIVAIVVCVLIVVVGEIGRAHV